MGSGWARKRHLRGQKSFFGAVLLIFLFYFFTRTVYTGYVVWVCNGLGKGKDGLLVDVINLVRLDATKHQKE